MKIFIKHISICLISLISASIYSQNYSIHHSNNVTVEGDLIKGTQLENTSSSLLFSNTITPKENRKPIPFMEFRVVDPYHSLLVGITAKNEVKFEDFTFAVSQTDPGMGLLPGMVVYQYGKPIATVALINKGDLVRIQFTKGRAYIYINGKAKSRVKCKLRLDNRAFVSFHSVNASISDFKTNFKVPKSATEWALNLNGFDKTTDKITSPQSNKNKGLLSVNHLDATQKGNLSFKTAKTNKPKIIGFTRKEPKSKNDFYLGIKLHKGKGELYSDGVLLKSFPVKAKDNITFDVKEDVIKVKKNKVTKHTFTKSGKGFNIGILATKPNTDFGEIKTNIPENTPMWYKMRGFVATKNGSELHPSNSLTGNSASHSVAVQPQIPDDDMHSISFKVKNDTTTKVIGISSIERPETYQDFDLMIRFYSKGGIALYRKGIKFKKIINFYEGRTYTIKASSTQFEFYENENLLEKSTIVYQKNSGKSPSKATSSSTTPTTPSKATSSSTTPTTPIKLPQKYFWFSSKQPATFYNITTKVLNTSNLISTSEVVNDQFVELRRHFDGSFHKVKKRLKFVYDEDYSTTNMECHIYNSSHQIVYSSSFEQISLGDNRCEINLSEAALVNKKYYTLEIENNKKEKRVLRFYYRKPPNETSGISVD